MTKLTDEIIKFAEGCHNKQQHKVAVLSPMLINYGKQYGIIKEIDGKLYCGDCEIIEEKPLKKFF